MPGLKAVLESLDGVDDPIKALYEEKDGKFILQLDGADQHPSVQNLKNSYTAEVNKRKEMQKTFNEMKAKVETIPDDFDPDEWSRLRAADEQREKDPDGKDLRAQVDAAVATIKTQLETKHAKDLKKRDDEIAARDDVIKKHVTYRDNSLLERVLNESLEKVGVSNAARRKGALALLKPMAEVVEEDDGEPVVRMRNEHGGGEVPSFITNWSSTDDGKAYVEPAKGSDAGSGGGPQQKFGNGKGGPGKGKNDGDFGGDRKAREAAIGAKFPELPAT